MTQTSSSPAHLLVKTFSQTETTEDLIFFVAGTDNMLTFCQKLLEQYDMEGQSPLVKEVNAQCTTHGVLPGVLFSEIRKVLLALNHFHDAKSNYYATLGLSESASRDEVKKAYRNLSKKYHPDRLDDPGKGAQKFMEIAGAYHAILAADSNHQPVADTQWRNQQGRRNRRKRDQRRFFIVLLLLICILLGITVFLSIRYDRNVISNQISLYNEQAEKKQIAPLSAPAAKIETDPVEAEVSENRPGTEEPGFFIHQSTSKPAEQKNLLIEPVAIKATTGPLRDDHASQLSTIPSARPLESAITQQENPGEGMSEPAIPPQPEREEPAKKTPKDKNQENLIPEISEPSLPLQHPAERQTSKTPVYENRQDYQSEISEPAMPPQHLAEEKPRKTPMNNKQKEQTEQKEKVSTESAISSIISQYADRYNHRDLEGFLSLFTGQATENGNPLSTLAEQYRSLFSHTKAIDLTISNIEWAKKQETFPAHGLFRVAYTYNDDRTREHTGTIHFNIVRNQDTFKIDALDYEFD